VLYRTPNNVVRERQPLRRLHILFVDSDAVARERMQQALGEGYSLEFADSAADAYARIEAHTPDVLISELSLGQQSGLDLCRAIRGNPSINTLPIMLLTALATLQEKVSGFEAGADDYVVKPYDTRHLAARIRLLVRIKHLEQNL
jgi:DNA-binding response OmpR family regulator